jgi:hypothetical protein
MRKVLIIFLLAMLIFAGCSKPATETVETSSVTSEATETSEETTAVDGENVISIDVEIKVNNDDNFAKLKGLQVRINNKEDLFFSHNFFVTLEDLEMLAEKRNIKYGFNKDSKKLTLGDREHTLVTINLEEEMSAYGDVRYLESGGKIYVDTWDVYSGLGFSSVSKSSKGVYFYDPNLEEKDENVEG